jgi:flagellin-like hook-associated protein FlgL
MNRVATFAVQNLNLSNALEMQKRLVDSNIQVSSGKVSPNYLGVAIDSRQLVNLKSTLTATESFTKNIDQIEQRLATMESNTANAFDVASQFRELLVGALNGNNAPDTAINQRAGDLINTLAGLLNVKQGDRYLFSGARTDTPPIDVTSLFATTPPLVDAAEFTGGATTSTTGITSLPGIVSVQVETANADDAFQLQYDDVTQIFTLTNLNGNASDQVALGGVPPAGQTKELTFTVGGERVVVTIDENFDAGTAITNDTVTGAVAGGAGAFGAITVTATSGDISNIDQNTIETSGTAANATLTLNSTDGTFVAAGVNLSVDGSLVPVTLTNPLTGATMSLQINVTTGLDNAAIADPGTEVQLGNFLANIAATNGTINYTDARPGDPGYDPDNPAFYKGDLQELSARIDPSTTIDYGVTGAEPGFEKLFRALFMAKNANVSPGNIDTDTLNSALGLALDAIAEIPNIRSRIGSDRAILEETKSRHEDFLIATKDAVSVIEDVDVVAAVARISTQQTQLEASYTLTARLSQLSLVNFLR